jgi:hypothetical protein
LTFLVSQEFSHVVWLVPVLTYKQEFILETKCEDGEVDLENRIFYSQIIIIYLDHLKDHPKNHYDSFPAALVGTAAAQAATLRPAAALSIYINLHHQEDNFEGMFC